MQLKSNWVHLLEFYVCRCCQLAAMHAELQIAFLRGESFLSLSWGADPQSTNLGGYSPPSPPPPCSSPYACEFYFCYLNESNLIGWHGRIQLYTLALVSMDLLTSWLHYSVNKFHRNLYLGLITDTIVLMWLSIIISRYY